MKTTELDLSVSKLIEISIQRTLILTFPLFQKSSTIDVESILKSIWIRN